METSAPYSPLDVFERNIKDGRNYLNNNDIAKAAQCFEKAYDIKSNEPELPFVLATLYQKLKAPEKSERFFRKTIALKPYHFEYLYAYAMFLVGFSRFDDAIEILLRCAKLQPDNAQLLNDLGVIYSEKEDSVKAVDFLLQASEKKPDYLVPLINLGHLYLRLRDLEKAEELAARLSKQSPGDKEVVELSSKLSEAKKHTEKMPLQAKTELRFSDADASFQIEPLRMIEQFGQRISKDKIGLSVVVPVYNEEDNVPVLYKELVETLKTLKQEYEIIFIDDGSTDKSRDALARIAATDRRVKVIFFRRNYGQTAALGAGFKYARGEVVVTLDADLQNDPADIPKLLAKMAEGYDLVNGWRKDRRDKMLSRKVPSMIANKIINKLIEGTNVQLNDFGCTLKAYKKGIVKNIHLYGEMHRFIPVFAAWIGVKVTEIPVNHRARLHGTAKYNLSRVSRVIFDLIVVRFFSDYMTRPIQFFGKIAKKITGWGLLTIAALAALGFFKVLPISLNTVLLLTAFVLFSGLQMLTMGLIGELMIRFYFEVQHKDYYVVESILNDSDAERP
jgi:glycosyltransferase involved in cell wall biosynthesis/Flp pilus assembly protein TadD